jgi:hypothetical protein
VGFLGKKSNLVFGLAVSILVGMYAGVFIARPDQLFADDTYFYLQVAWNFARGMGSTFNTIMPTNGYHPLWMLLCAAVYKIVGSSKTAGVHGIAVLVTLLDVLMLLTVRRLLKKVADDLWVLAFALLIPFSFLSQLGTEGALSGLFLSLLMVYAYEMSVSPTGKTATIFNLVAALAVLSRLDNIFIVGFVWISVWIALGKEDEWLGRRLQLAMLPIYVVLWGTYLGINWVYFHTLQPISGLLKSNSSVHHSLGTNLPHTAWVALVFVLVGFGGVALFKRDRFFQVVEVPFFLGVVCHGAYIVLRMSTETRWSWYYTSWILLGAVLLARTGSVVLKHRRWLATPLSALMVVLLAVGWVKLSYQRCYLAPDIRPPAEFNEVVYKQAGIRRAFAYDQPGMLAYYSDVEIVPLDGLMGTIAFQHDLWTKGANQVVLENHIDGFIGPVMPFNVDDEKNFCDHLFLSAVKLHCAADGPGRWEVTSVDIYSRVPNLPAGRLLLDARQVVWVNKNGVTVWRIAPTVDERTGSVGAN